jgi:hypothetical protein
MTSIDDLFKGRHFDREIIILGVRWYLRFKLGLRDLVEMMAERGIDFAHTTIMGWIAPTEGAFPAYAREDRTHLARSLRESIDRFIRPVCSGARAFRRSPRAVQGFDVRAAGGRQCITRRARRRRSGH